jgi:putative Mg2+ transporter-C (MgtC) family protein
MDSFWQWLHRETGWFLSSTIIRLVLAAVLGGLVGLEREFKRRPAGLRTNMFICFGSAMFTLLSYRMASEFGGDHTRIAAQIIPGIGFIGAGSILHSRGSVTGLTTAATIFVVASIGMAVGAGLYFPSIFATGLILIALLLLGVMETRLNLKPLVMGHDATGEDADSIIAAVNQILEEEHHNMLSVQVGRSNHHHRVQFNVDATSAEHDSLMKRFRQCPAIAHISSQDVSERE